MGRENVRDLNVIVIRKNVASRKIELKFRNKLNV